MKSGRKAIQSAIKFIQLSAVSLLAQQALAAGSVTLDVNGSTTNTTIASGTAVSLQANVTSPALAYRIAFYEDGALLSSCPQYPTATVSCTISSISGGTHVFTNTTTYLNNENQGPAGGTTNVASNAVTITAIGPNVAITPKYQILGITYAPPGPNSLVSYQTANTITTTLSDSASYQGSKTLGLTLAASGGIPDFGSLGVTVSQTEGSSETTTSQNQLSIGVSATTLGKTNGPALTAPGVTPVVTANTTIDHDYDTVTLWLNPVALYYVGTNQGTSTSVTMMGLASDSTDTNVAGMETATVQMGALNGHLPMPAGVAIQLARAWANNGQTPPVDGVALTQADYAQILAADPYMNPSYPFDYENGYGATTTSPDGRFTLVSTSGGNPSSFSYGSNNTTDTLTFGYTNVATATNTASSQQTVTFGISFWVTVGSAANTFKTTLSDSTKQIWTHTASTQVATSKVITNTLTLAPPCSQPGCYNSYPVIEVFQDNLYGTFMFFPTY